MVAVVVDSVEVVEAVVVEVVVVSSEADDDAPTGAKFWLIMAETLEFDAKIKAELFTSPNCAGVKPEELLEFWDGACDPIKIELPGMNGLI